MRVSTFSWPKPRRGSAFSMSTSSRTVCDAVGVDAGRARAARSRPSCRRSPARGGRCRRRRSPRPRSRRGSPTGASGRPPHVGLGAQVQVDAAAVVAVERLDHDRDSPSGSAASHRLVGDRTVSERGTGTPGGAEQVVGERLVRGDVDRDRWRPRGHGGADALLVDALAELHQAVPVEADPGDVARDRLVDDRLGRRPEGRPLGDADQPLDLGARSRRRRLRRPAPRGC